MVTVVRVSPLELLEEPGAPYVVDAEPLEEDLAKVERAVVAAKRDADVLAAYVHWGVGALPFSTIVLDYQRDLARVLVDTGADLVVGTHPHVLLPAETHRDAYIIYSLGNFLFTEKPNLPLSNVGGAMVVGVDENSRSIGSVEIIPLRLDDEGLPWICDDPLRYPEVTNFAYTTRSLAKTCRYCNEPVPRFVLKP